MKTARLLLAVSAVLTLSTCRAGETTARSPASERERSVVVYSSADKEFAELIFAAFEKKTGMKVLPVYDTEETKTAGLTSRLMAEASHPKADVFWSSDISRAVALVDRGIAAPYKSSSAKEIPSRYKDPGGRWTGFAARIRVILYNTEQVKPANAPQSIEDFRGAAWKGRFAIPNPHFGTMSFQAAALFVKWGDEKATALFRSLKDNGAIIAAGNADVKDRVSDGRVAAGIVDEDDATVAVREKKSVAIVIPDQEGSNPLGTPVMPNTAMLIKGALHPQEAREFLDFLLSPEAEKILAESDAAQFPLHPGVPGPASLPPLDKIRPMDVDYGAVAKKLDVMDSMLKEALGI